MFEWCFDLKHDDPCQSGVLSDEDTTEVWEVEKEEGIKDFRKNRDRRVGDQ